MESLVDRAAACPQCVLHRPQLHLSYRVSQRTSFLATTIADDVTSFIDKWTSSYNWLVACSSALGCCCVLRQKPSWSSRQRRAKFTIKAVAQEDAHTRAVRRWLDDFVFALELCPWAKAADETRGIRIVSSLSTTEAGVLEDLRREEELLLCGPEVVGNRTSAASTMRSTLLVCHFVQQWQSYDSFIDFVVNVLEETDDCQVVAFHPKFALYDSGMEAADIVSRAPRPVLHILRQMDLESVQPYDNVVELLLRNRRRALRIGHRGMDELLKECG